MRKLTTQAGLIILACYVEAARLTEVARRKGLWVALNEAGGIDPSRIITLLIMAFVVLMFILSFVPELEDAITNSTITNEFVNAMLGIMVWVLPIGALIAILIAIFRLGRSGRGG
jgi:hypothetical protein